MPRCLLPALLIFLSGCAKASVPTASSAVSEAQSAPPDKRALIVAVSDYAPGTGWGSIHAENDVVLIQPTLARHGFDSIHVLRGGSATRSGIIRAIQERLIQPAQRGDVLFLHFSVHGQRIPDDNGDELDGYDEAVVPYDAPATASDDYQGEKHLRDDEVNRLVQQMRAKVGETGNVTVTLDSCFSGAPRGILPLRRGGVETLVAVRGGPPLGPPAKRPPSAYEEDSGSGFFDRVTGPEGVPRAVFAEAGGDFAPSVILSASRHNQYAYETIGPNGEPAGSLSIALTHELGRLPAGATYRLLHEKVKRYLESRVSNHPQIEGAVDALLFSGVIAPTMPFTRVESVADDRVILAAGLLTGLQEGSEVEFHSEGAPRPSSETYLASGRVISSVPQRAVVQLDRPAEETALSSSRVFVTSYHLGNQRLRVQLAVKDPELQARIRDHLTEQEGVLELVRDNPDVIVFSRPDEESGAHQIAIETRAGGVSLGSPLDALSRELRIELANRLIDFARNRYLRDLDIRSEELDVSIRLIPVSVTDCPGEEVSADCTITRLDPKPEIKGRNHTVWRAGEYFKLEVENRGCRESYVSILDLAPDGPIRLLWPLSAPGDQKPLPVGRNHEFDVIYEVTEPHGVDVILLIASTEPLDLGLLTTRRGTPRAVGEPIILSRRSAATRSLAIRVVP